MSNDTHGERVDRYQAVNERMAALSRKWGIPLEKISERTIDFLDWYDDLLEAAKRSYTQGPRGTV